MYLVLVLSIFATSNVIPVITPTSPSRRFKLSLQNCKYSGNELFQIPTSSLSACAAHCNSMAPICKSFVRKNGRCEMLHVGKCPVPCDSSADVSTEWELYVPDGKTKQMLYSGSIPFTFNYVRVKLLWILYVFLLTLTLNRTGKIIPFHCLNRELAKLSVCHVWFNLYGFRFSFRYRNCICQNPK